MTLKINQKGFGVIESMVTIIALILIVSVGYFVFSAGKNNTTDSIKTVTKTESSDKKDTNKSKKEFTPVSYLDVKELSIRVPLSAPIKDVTYQYSPPTEQKINPNSAGTAYFPATVVFTSKSLSDKSRTCGGSTDASNPHVIMIIGKTEGQFKPGSFSTSPTSEDVLLKQFKNFSVVTSVDQYEPCAVSSPNKAIEQEADNIREELTTALKQAEEI